MGCNLKPILTYLKNNRCQPAQIISLTHSLTHSKVKSQKSKRANRVDRVCVWACGCAAMTLPIMLFGKVGDAEDKNVQKSKIESDVGSVEVGSHSLFIH